jgi:glycosyltransferase involved in cell wall biosynthesis
MGLLRGLSYYIAQSLTLPLIRWYADGVLVTSEPDKDYLTAQGVAANRILVIQGGVDLEEAVSSPIRTDIRYEAVFVGRFHPQKGTTELIDIWAKVVAKTPTAQLAMIGEGSMKSRIQREIARLGLEKNVGLLGFHDGVDKFSIIKASKIVVHPATYDSGGMAMCEALACGLPGISFDLAPLRTYYPKGVLKIPCFDRQAFADGICRLLSDSHLYRKLSQDALSHAQDWDWGKRVLLFWHFVDTITNLPVASVSQLHGLG